MITKQRALERLQSVQRLATLSAPFLINQRTGQRYTKRKRKLLKEYLRPYLPCVSRMSTFTEIRQVGVAILVTVIVFELSHLFCVAKVPTFTGIRRVGVALPVFVLVFEPSHLRCMAKVPTVTRMYVPARK